VLPKSVLLGGLNYQHRAPSLPEHAAAPCIAYAETTLFGSCAIAQRYLPSLGEPLRRIRGPDSAIVLLGLSAVLLRPTRDAGLLKLRLSPFRSIESRHSHDQPRTGCARAARLD